MGLAFRDLFLHFWVLGSLGSTFRVLGSLGSPFSADPGVGKGRQGSRFRYDHGIPIFSKLYNRNVNLPIDFNQCKYLMSFCEPLVSEEALK